MTTTRRPGAANTNNEPSSKAASAVAIGHEALLDWVARVCAGKVTRSSQVTGGNRYRSWAVDVETPDGRTLPVYLRHQLPRPPSAEPYTLAREAAILRAVVDSAANTTIRAPQLIAVHADGHSVLSERLPGRADFRRLADAGHRVTVVQEFVAAIARLHQLDLSGVRLDGLDRGSTIADCVAHEIATWRAMYDESGERDSLIDLALAWLQANLPHPEEPCVLVHGDAGPGNFLFEGGHMTALLDWELAHLGDPMEDLAWFSMRCVMEPVPDFGDRIRDYERLTGRAVNRARVLYHRVLVSTRIVILRHRNVTGEPGNSIVSRGLNRRLLIDALAGAADAGLPAPVLVEAASTSRTGLYDGIIEDLRLKMAGRSNDAEIVAAAKNAAKVLKYLSACDRLGPAIEAADFAALASVLGQRPASVEDGQAQLVQGFVAKEIAIEAVLATFAGMVQRAAQLSAASSGGIAGRTFPELP